MTGLRIECYLQTGTGPLSVVVPAVSDLQVGIEGCHPGWLVCRLLRSV